MSVHLADQDLISLTGDCSLEDAEPLWHLLTTHANAAVDWSACTGAHSAVIQVLLAAQPRITGTPASEFLMRHIRPLFGFGVST